MAADLVYLLVYLFARLAWVEEAWHIYTVVVCLPWVQDQYLELTTWVHPDTFLYGAGERSSETLHLNRNGMPWTIWSHDLGPTFLLQNMYGLHPFLMALEPGVRVGVWVGR
jgi:alpha-glucosidase (family GH31 glycosyl hydrolase)